jgi:hypothetical protein
MSSCSRGKVELRDIKLKSDLTYKEKPVSLVDSKERVTRNQVDKIYKVIWGDQGNENDAAWEIEDYLRDAYSSFYNKW